MQMTARGQGHSPPGAPGKGCERCPLVSLQYFRASDPVIPLRPFLRETLLVTTTTVAVEESGGVKMESVLGFLNFSFILNFLLEESFVKY